MSDVSGRPPLVAGADAPVAFVSPDATIDLTNCDREPIHIPGAIQPYGVLLSLDTTTLEILQASASSASLLGVRAEQLIGCTIDETFGADAAAAVRRMCAASEPQAFGALALGPADRPFDVTLHHSGATAIMELEPSEGMERVSTEQLRTAMRSTVSRLEQAETLAELAQGVAAEMREVTGFDRVWVYRFHPDWHGEIIGESKRDDIETWMGMHYPASDIPAQARALFLRNWVRAIPDIRFVPSPLVPVNDPRTGEPLDLGGTLLRSVSPIHIQYLTNMGVTASLVISLIHRGTLWGLISGHHYSGPKRVSSSVRLLCEFLAQALSLQIGTVDRLEERELELAVRAAHTRLVAQLSADNAPLEEKLLDGPVTLLELVRASGASVVRGNDVASRGDVPSDDQVRELAEWLRQRDEEVYSTDRLPEVFPPAKAYADVGSGILTVPLARDRRDLVIWFRCEQRQTVRWAGDPRKPVSIAPDGSRRLHPRGSFELWEEEARGTSAPWRESERGEALDLRRALLDVFIRQAEEIAQLNEELMVTNHQLEESAVELEVQAEELLSQRADREDLLTRERLARSEAERANKAKADFLAVMSHELRTPLNAIGGYSELMTLGVRGPVTDEQLSDLERIQVNQRHLLGLINSILNFTKLEAGQIQFRLERIDLVALVHGLEALVSPQMSAKSLDFSVESCAGPLFVQADEEKLRQILLNLLTNALKFTPAGGRITVDCISDGGTARVRVTDTGRGISPAHLESVFEPFVQVDRHVTPSSEQGVGLGLAISRELARAMHGTLGAESEQGRGSAFTLTLPRVH